MEFRIPLGCPHQGCQGRHFRHHQQADRPVKGTKCEAASFQRYECL
jgi:hypothetical protein